jgi:hypothetical protein
VLKGLGDECVEASLARRHQSSSCGVIALRASGPCALVTWLSVDRGLVTASNINDYRVPSEIGRRAQLNYPEAIKRAKAAKKAANI